MELLDVMKNLSIKNSDDQSKELLFKTYSAYIDKVDTEFVFTNYTDKTLLIVSQFGKIGSMLYVQKDQVHSPLGSNNIYSTKIIFGATGEEPQVAARYLAEELNIQNLYIFINLKSYDIETVKACKDIILDFSKEE